MKKEKKEETKGEKIKIKKVRVKEEGNEGI